MYLDFSSSQSSNPRSDLGDLGLEIHWIGHIGNVLNIGDLGLEDIGSVLNIGDLGLENIGRLSSQVELLKSQGYTALTALVWTFRQFHLFTYKSIGTNYKHKFFSVFQLQAVFQLVKIALSRLVTTLWSLCVQVVHVSPQRVYL